MTDRQTDTARQQRLRYAERRAVITTIELDFSAGLGIATARNITLPVTLLGDLQRVTADDRLRHVSLFVCTLRDISQHCTDRRSFSGTRISVHRCHNDHQHCHPVLQTPEQDVRTRANGHVDARAKQ